MNRRLLVVLVVGLVLVVTLFALLLGGRTAKPTPTQTPVASPTVTPDPLAEDRALLERLSRELAVKYYTFGDVTNPAYAASIRPYLTNKWFADYTSTFRYADRVPLFEPISSTFKSQELSGDSESGTATALVTLVTSKRQNGETFEQTIRIDWERSGTRWSATAVNVEEFGGPDGE